MSKFQMSSTELFILLNFYSVGPWFCLNLIVTVPWFSFVFDFTGVCSHETLNVLEKCSHFKDILERLWTFKETLAILKRLKL